MNFYALSTPNCTSCTLILSLAYILTSSSCIEKHKRKLRQNQLQHQRKNHNQSAKARQQNKRLACLSPIISIDLQHKVDSILTDHVRIHASSMIVQSTNDHPHSKSMAKSLSSKEKISSMNINEYIKERDKYRKLIISSLSSSQQANPNAQEVHQVLH